MITRIVAVMLAAWIMVSCGGPPAQEMMLIPMPQSVEVTGKPLEIEKLMVIAPGMSESKLRTAMSLFEANCPGVTIDNTNTNTADMVVEINIEPSADRPEEGYSLKIEDDTATITASSDKGAFYGLQTLSQLIFEYDGAWYINRVEIDDYPAFAIRGFMHDVGRNFQTLESLKHQLDIFALYKINVFHWHLTDYPAWRIECKAYPQLNDPKYQKPGRDEGKFYTYDQIRELIAYAADRNITVIPEIDVPGHSTYFNDTFGFGMASRQGMEVLKKCFDEFFSEIPASDCPYMHIGSDEVHIDNPKEFMAYIEDIVHAGGRIPIIWDPGLPAAPSTVRQVWRDGDLNQLHDMATGETPVIDSYQGYINFFEPIALVNRIFLHNGCDAEKGSKNALGGILCCWPDARVADKANIYRHNAVYPSMLAFAERYWKGGDSGCKGSKNLAPDQGTPQYDAIYAFEDRMIYHRNRFLSAEAFPWVPNVNMCWRVSEPLGHAGNQDSVFSIETAEVDASSWQRVYGGTVDVDALAKKVGWMSDSATVYAVAYIESDIDRTLPCWIGFETPARSNRFSGGIPRQGHWDANGGNVWVNGVQLTAPEWNEPGAYRYLVHTWHLPANEIPFTDEQLYWARKPTEVFFKKGLNRIMIKAPKAFAGQRWAFTFVPYEESNGKLSRPTGLVFKDVVTE